MTSTLKQFEREREVEKTDILSEIIAIQRLKRRNANENIDEREVEIF